MQNIQLRSPGYFLLIALSIITGALSHLFWDFFTHNENYWLESFDFLNAPILVTHLGILRIYKILQHGSSLLGGIVVVYFYYRWYRYAPVHIVDKKYLLNKNSKIRILCSLTALSTLIAFAIGFNFVNNPFDNFWAFRLFSVKVAVVWMSTSFILLTVYSFWWRFSHSTG